MGDRLQGSDRWTAHRLAVLIGEAQGASAKPMRLLTVYGDRPMPTAQLSSWNRDGMA